MLGLGGGGIAVLWSSRSVVECDSVSLCYFTLPTYFTLLTYLANLGGGLVRGGDLLRLVREDDAPG